MTTPKDRVNNMQAAFDHVWKTFVTDGAPQSFDANRNVCCYGHPDMPGCAIACLVSPEVRGKLRAWELTPDIGDTSIGMVPFDTGLAEVNQGFYSALQTAHDAARPSGAMSFRYRIQQNLIGVAREFRLVPLA